MQAVQQYTWARIGAHEKAEQAKAVTAFEAAKLLNFRFVKHHQLSNEEVDLLQTSFPFITAEVISNLVEEKDDYYLAASIVDVGYDLWEFWSDNRSKLPHWYGVAKNIALIQPSSAFMERVFSILRACMDERQTSSFSDRIAAAALLMYNRERGK